MYVALYDYFLKSNYQQAPPPTEDGQDVTTPTGNAVRTVSTTYLIDKIAEANGHAVHETPVGFKWVARAMVEENALIGGEESGGFGITGHLRNKDGIIVALMLAIAHSEEPLDARLDRLRDTYGDIVQDRMSVDCRDDRKAATMAKLEEEIPETIADTVVEDVITKDGFKLILTDGSWVLIRPSGTEPKLRIYAEASTQNRVGELLHSGQILLESVVK